MNGDKHNFSTRLLEIFRKFDGHAPSNQQQQWTEIDDFVAALSLSGLSRKDIYHLVHDLYKDGINTMPKESLDAISNYIDGLIGQVSIQHIVRLPNETGDVDTHAKYVRSMDWLKH